MPRLVGAARLHRRDDMHQAGVFTTSFQHLRHDRFLADVALGDVLDRDPRLRCQRCRPLAHAVAQRRGKLRVIEDANPDRVEKLRHSRGVAHRGKRPGHHHPVVTRQHAGDPIVIALAERPRHLALDSFGTGGRCYPLFGSGSAGLGMVAPTGLVSRPTLSEPLFASASRLSTFERSSRRRLPETFRRSTYQFASLARSGYVKDVTEISPSSTSLRYLPEMRW